MVQIPYIALAVLDPLAEKLEDKAKLLYAGASGAECRDIISAYNGPAYGYVNCVPRIVSRGHVSHRVRWAKPTAQAPVKEIKESELVSIEEPVELPIVEAPEVNAPVKPIETLEEMKARFNINNTSNTTPAPAA